MVLWSTSLLSRPRGAEKGACICGLLVVHKTAHDETVGETSQGEAGVAVDMAWAMLASLAFAGEVVLPEQVGLPLSRRT